ncbi:hypothetical protein [Nocardia sp. NPDC019395]|uniref:hypothetical protein n=1 Tax=Nocardia sp. NPDC019395 TaxID=3154686 RepID=UPI0033CBA01C
MNTAGPAELFCRATSQLATEVRAVQSTYGKHLRAAVAGVRAQIRDMPEVDRAGALRITPPSPENVVWLPGRVWPGEAERAALPARGERPPRVWFRSDAVDYDILPDADGLPCGLSFTAMEPDLARRTHWARATDRRGDREYEKATADAIRGRVGYQWVDRSDTEHVPAPWHHPGEDEQMFSVSPHGTPQYHEINVKVGHDSAGSPVYETVAVDGWAFGTYLSTNPDFWRIAERRGGDLVVTGCDIGGTPARSTARILYSNGFERPVHGATGGVWMQAHHPDGRLQAIEVPGKFDPQWDPHPTLSSLVVIDGEFVTLHPSDFSTPAG